MIEAKSSTTSFTHRQRADWEEQISVNKPKGIHRRLSGVKHDKVMILLALIEVVFLVLGIHITIGPTPHTRASTATLSNSIESVAIIVVTIVAVMLVVGVKAFNDWQKERQVVGLHRNREHRTVKVTLSGPLLASGSVLSVLEAEELSGIGLMASDSSFDWTQVPRKYWSSRQSVSTWREHFHMLSTILKVAPHHTTGVTSCEDRPVRSSNVSFRRPSARYRLRASSKAHSGLNSFLGILFFSILVCPATALSGLERVVVAGQGFSGVTAGLSGYALLGHQADQRVDPVLHGSVFGVWGITFALFLLCQTYWILPEKKSLYIVIVLILSAAFTGMAAPTAKTIPLGITTYGPLFVVISATVVYVVFDKRRPTPEFNARDVEAGPARTGETMALPRLPRDGN